MSYVGDILINPNILTSLNLFARLSPLKGSKGLKNK